MKKSALSNEAARQAQERTSPWKRPRLWRELAVIFLGSLLFAASMNCIVLPTGMYSGGFLGLAQLLRMGLESLVPGLQSLGDLAGAIYFLLNLPLLAIAWSRFGHYFLGKTIACVLFYSVLLAVIPIPEVGVFDEVLTACVIGGLLCPKFSSRKAGFWTIMASIVSIVAWNMVPALVPVFKNVGFFMLAVCGAVFILISLVDPEKVKQ